MLETTEETATDAQVETDARSDRFAVHRGGGFVKVPRDLIGDVLENGVPSLVDLEDAIVAGYILRHHELRGYSPTLRQLQDLSGRGRGRVMQSLMRLSTRGTIRARKVKFHNKQTGEEGWKWRFEIPSDSTLRRMIAAGGIDAPAASRWVAIPAHVASHKSILAAAVWVIVSELAVREGVAVTSPAHLATMLRCHRDTAARLLKAVGARAIARTNHGIVYAVGTGIKIRPGSPLLTIAGVGCKLPKDERDRARIRARLDRVLAILEREGIDSGAALEQATAALTSAGDGLASVVGVVRILEETHMREALADPMARETIVRLFSWRLRARIGGAPSVRAPRSERRAARRAAVVLQASSPDVCGTCDGDHFVLEHDELGRDVWAQCPACCRRE